MHKIEKIGDGLFYIKFIGKFPLSEAESYKKSFSEAIKGLETYSILVDLIDATFLNIESIDFVLDLLKRSQNRLKRSAYVITQNPPLDVAFKYLFDKAPSPKRKIVSDLEEAKKWLGLFDISIKKE